MPMSSMQISAMTGSFNAQVAHGMQHSAMISQMYGGYSPMHGTQPVPSQGQQFAGLAMNTLGNMGMQAMGSQSVNQFSGGMAQPFAQTGQFLLGQTMYGAQQQQMLDANLRQSYRFQNQLGGRGFTQSEMGSIGADLRSISMERGPAGQTTNFEELGRLASNMGRMGMAEGVRSAKDFNEKFKQMLESVKTIATELGTSLEEAQKVMASMKGSGVFRNQGQLASQIRGAAVAGNLSTGELSGMALIGSQISRSVGGRGEAGARAGINALGQIGVATQAGIIREEDIYNVTGLTGAEGRRAFAQRNLQQDAQFFSSGLGRRALAAMAGKDGNLDMKDVRAFMSGGVGTDDTMRRAYENLGEVGRANFIRNEGRLRGEAMAQFGGLGKAVVARNWLEGRNMNMNEMDDRSMLFFQRKFKMGRDEADQTIKMARNLDNIMLKHQESQENDQYQRMLEERRRAQSPREILNRAGMYRRGFNQSFQQFGADLYNNLSTNINEVMQAGSGGYQDVRRGDMAREIRRMYMGGSAARGLYERQFAGIELSADQQKLSTELFGETSGQLSESQFARFRGGQANRLRAAGFDPSKIQNIDDYRSLQARNEEMRIGFETGGSGIVERMGGIDDATTKALRANLATGAAQGKGDEFLKAFERGLKELNTTQGKELAKEFEKANKETQAKMAKDLISGVGLGNAVSNKFGTLADTPVTGGRRATREAELLDVGRGLTAGLSGSGSSLLNLELGKDYRQGASDLTDLLGGKTTMIGGLVDQVAGEGSLLSDKVGYLDAARTLAVKKRDSIAKDVAQSPRNLLKSGLAMGGRALVRMGVADEGFAEGLVNKGGFTGKGGLIDRLAKASGYADNVERAAEDTTRGFLGGTTNNEMQMAAEFIRSKEGRDMQASVFSQDVQVRAAARLKMENRRVELMSLKHRRSTEHTEMRGLQAIEAAAALNDLGPNATREEKEAAAKRIFGDEGTVEALESAGNTASVDFNEQARRKRGQLFQGLRERAKQDLTKSKKALADFEERKRTGKINKDELISAGSSKFIEKMNERRQLMAGLSADGSESDEIILGVAQKRGDELEAQFVGMDAKAQERLAEDLEKRGETEQAASVRRQKSIVQRLKKSGSIGSAQEAQDIAGMLGLGLEKKDLKGTTDDKLETIMQGSGLDLLEGGKSEEVRAKLEQILTAKGEDGKKMERGDRAAAIRGLQESGILLDAQQAKQDESSRQNDPSFRALEKVADNTSKIVGHTEGITDAVREVTAAIVEKAPSEGGQQ